jgi:hypothetical protein
MNFKPKLKLKQVIKKLKKQDYAVVRVKNNNLLMKKVKEIKN